MIAEDSANSQKLELKLTSGWSAKCKEFRRKMKDLGVNDCGGQREFAETGAKVDLSMECKM